MTSYTYRWEKDGLKFSLFKHATSRSFMTMSTNNDEIADPIGVP